MSPSQNPGRDRTSGGKPPRAGLARGRPTTAAKQPFGIAGSLLLHAGIVAGSLIAWQHALDLPRESTPIPVDLITIAPKTNIAPMAPPQKTVEARNDFAPPPIIVPPPPKIETIEPGPAKPVPVPKTTPPPKKPTVQEDFSTLLNKLTKPPPPPKNARKGPQRIAGIGSQSAMTADLADALRGQIARCWNTITFDGGPDPDADVVDFDLFLNPDGSVARPPQLSADSAHAAAVNPYTRAAAESAEIAINKCAPYKLPANQYSEWREINPLHFDPRQMMGQ